MTITNGYATLAEYKSWMAVRGLSGSVGTDTSDDAVIESTIEMVSRYIDRWTGRRFYKDSVDAVRYYTAEDSDCVKIDDLSAAPTTVSADYANTRLYTDLTTAEYDLYPDNALLDGFPYTQILINPTSAIHSYFPTTRRGIKITAKFGWPAVPADIKDATLSICQSVNSNRSGQSSQGKVTVTAAGIVIRPEDVPAFAQKIIESYQVKV